MQSRLIAMLTTGSMIYQQESSLSLSSIIFGSMISCITDSLLYISSCSCCWCFSRSESFLLWRLSLNKQTFFPCVLHFSVFRF